MATPYKHKIWKKLNLQMKKQTKIFLSFCTLIILATIVFFYQIGVQFGNGVENATKNISMANKQIKSL